MNRPDLPCFVLLFTSASLFACSDPAATSTDASGSDTSGSVLDTAPSDAPQQEVGADATVEPDVGPGSDAPDTSPPDPPGGISPVSLEWFLQSDAGEGGVITADAAAGLGGDLVIAASFRGHIAFGGKTVSTAVGGQPEGLLTRVTAAGTVAYLRSLGTGISVGAVAQLAGGEVLACLSFGKEAAPPADLGTALGGATAGLVAVRFDAVGTVTGAESLSTSETVYCTAMEPLGAGAVVGGFATGNVSFTDGSTTTVPEAVFYPGRAYFAYLGADLAVSSVDFVTGSAASDVLKLVPEPSGGLLVIGGFGGYPIGATSVFGEGTPGAVTLTALSSDDDPAMDIYVARYSAPGALTWARRIRSYGNGTPGEAWAGARADGTWEAAFRGDTVRADPLHPGEIHLAPSDGGRTYTVARFDKLANIAGNLSFPLMIYGRDGVNYTGIDLLPADAKIVLDAHSGKAITVPGSDETSLASGLVVGIWAATGALERVGVLPVRVPISTYPPALHGVVPIDDRSVLVYLNGSAPLTLTPGKGDPVVLENPGYERLVVARLRLD